MVHLHLFSWNMLLCISDADFIPKTELLKKREIQDWLLIWLLIWQLIKKLKVSYF